MIRFTSETLYTSYTSHPMVHFARMWMEFFTGEGAFILDPFARCGSVLAAATLSNRYAAGIDCNRANYDRYRQLLLDEQIVGMQGFFIEDCLHRLPWFNAGEFDLIITELPAAVNQDVFYECYRVLGSGSYMITVLKDKKRIDEVVGYAHSFSLQGELQWFQGESPPVEVLFFKKEVSIE